jgi:aryl carrier-like protein
VPIGRPLPNVTAWVLDAHGQPLPIGIPGELWVGGLGVARGYLGRDDLTRERFVHHGGERRYRTGDRVRRLPSGDLEFLGRLDTQVKIRGHRVELGEIEAALSADPAVRQAVVALQGDALVGYVVPAGNCGGEALSERLAESLPAYMVPQTWIILEHLPLTANGKVDRGALPAPAPASGGSSTPAADATPRTDLERKLASLWAEVLKRESVGRDENFFALGGHSLLAIRLLGRIAKQVGVRLSLRTLFEAPTIAKLAQQIDEAGGKARA